MNFWGRNVRNGVGVSIEILIIMKVVLIIMIICVFFYGIEIKLFD